MPATAPNPQISDSGLPVITTVFTAMATQPQAHFVKIVESPIIESVQETGKPEEID
jgi:hypothetical protein